MLTQRRSGPGVVGEWFSEWFGESFRDWFVEWFVGWFCVST